MAHKEFTLNKPEGLPPHPLWNAYHEDQQKFVKAVGEFPIDKIPEGLNIIRRRVIFKVDQNDDFPGKMKAKIVPDGN